MTQRGSDVDHLRWLKNAGFATWQDRRVLDVGCGSGHLCSLIAQNGAKKVVGVDIITPSTPDRGWTYLSVDLESDGWTGILRQAFEANPVDTILAFDILEHLSSPVRFLRDVHDLLRAGGQIVLTTPNISSWERWARGKTWSGATDPQHKVLFNRYSLAFLLERTGFGVETIQANMRSLEFLGPLSPPIGAQIFCVARAKQS